MFMVRIAVVSIAKTALTLTFWKESLTHRVILTYVLVQNSYLLGEPNRAAVMTLKRP